MVVKLGIYKFLRDNHIEIKKESSIPIDCKYFINSIWQALDRYLTVISIALESSAIDILACFDHSKGSRSAIQSAVKALEQWSANNIFSWTQRSAKNWLLTSREPTPVRRCNRQLQGTWTCCPNQILGVTMSNTFKWNCHVSDVIKRANKLTHFLIMLKRVNIPTHNIMCFHITSIRPVFEYCAPLYPCALLLIKAET